MFEEDFIDICANKNSTGVDEGLSVVCADTGARTPISPSVNCSIIGQP
jgi:hypothetical protein